MAFGINRKQLNQWKKRAENGEIAILTHYWLDSRFPNSKTVTKISCNDISKLISWGRKYNLNPEWIHYREGFPHFDVFGDRQLHILQNEGYEDQIKRFNLDQ